MESKNGGSRPALRAEAEGWRAEVRATGLVTDYADGHGWRARTAGHDPPYLHFGANML